MHSHSWYLVRTCTTVEPIHSKGTAYTPGTRYCSPIVCSFLVGIETNMVLGNLVGPTRRLARGPSALVGPYVS